MAETFCSIEFVRCFSDCWVAFFQRQTHIATSGPSDLVRFRTPTPNRVPHALPAPLPPPLPDSACASIHEVKVGADANIPNTDEPQDENSASSVPDKAALDEASHSMLVQRKSGILALASRGGKTRVNFDALGVVSEPPLQRAADAVRSIIQMASEPPVTCLVAETLVGPSAAGSTSSSGSKGRNGSSASCEAGASDLEEALDFGVELQSEAPSQENAASHRESQPAGQARSFSDPLEFDLCQDMGAPMVFELDFTERPEDLDSCGSEGQPRQPEAEPSVTTSPCRHPTTDVSVVDAAHLNSQDLLSPHWARPSWLVEADGKQTCSQAATMHSSDGKELQATDTQNCNIVSHRNLSTNSSMINAKFNLDSYTNHSNPSSMTPTISETLRLTWQLQQNTLIAAMGVSTPGPSTPLTALALGHTSAVPASPASGGPGPGPGPLGPGFVMGHAGTRCIAGVPAAGPGSYMAYAGNAANTLLYQQAHESTTVARSTGLVFEVDATKEDNMEDKVPEESPLPVGATLQPWEGRTQSGEAAPLPHPSRWRSETPSLKQAQQEPPLKRDNPTQQPTQSPDGAGPRLGSKHSETTTHSTFSFSHSQMFPHVPPLHLQQTTDVHQTHTPLPRPAAAGISVDEAERLLTVQHRPSSSLFTGNGDSPFTKGLASPGEAKHLEEDAGNVCTIFCQSAL
mmetsp:Transcript_42186/g.90625  ORF Transcript_42186/g.90625 Transcript_42186/m.90625 type:complete len:686 (+) Transcript_42186:152-2209(+)